MSAAIKNCHNERADIAEFFFNRSCLDYIFYIKVRVYEKSVYLAKTKEVAAVEIL